MTADENWLAEIASEHGFSRDAVETARAALRQGGGRMAQFSHADFGGMAQWSRGGMSMVGAMFDSGLKARFDAMMAELASLSDHATAMPKHAEPIAAASSESHNESAWPKTFGAPSSSGSQNGMRYAYFPDVRRLVVERGDERTIYDTGDYEISGVSQQQMAQGRLQFHSRSGDVDLSALSQVDDEAS